MNYICQSCGAYLDPGERCDCEGYIPELPPPFPAIKLGGEYDPYGKEFNDEFIRN